MRSRVLFYVALFFAGLVLQFGLAQFITLWGLAPNMILIFIVFAALNDGPVVGQWLGFFWGLAWDTMSVSLFGSRALTFTLIGYVVGMLSRKLDETKVSSQATIVLAASVVYTLLLWSVYEVFSPGESPMQLNYITILQPCYNVLLAPVIFTVGCALTAGLRHPEEL